MNEEKTWPTTCTKDTKLHLSNIIYAIYFLIQFYYFFFVFRLIIFSARCAHEIETRRKKKVSNSPLKRESFHISQKINIFSSYERIKFWIETLVSSSSACCGAFFFFSNHQSRVNKAIRKSIIKNWIMSWTFECVCFDQITQKIFPRIKFAICKNIYIE